jgi:lysophospholipase L1-like esterase
MRLLAVLIVVVLAVSVAAGVVLSRDNGPPFTGAVTMLGDSLNVGLEPYLAEELAGWDLRNHNRAGKRTEEGLDELRSLDEPLAPVLVVSLGTNDFNGDPELFGQLVEEILERAGTRRCVIWSTLWLYGPLDAFNAELRDAAKAHRNLELDDWAGLVESRRELLAFDEVHGSPEGYAERAARIARIAERCHPRPASS